MLTLNTQDLRKEDNHPVWMDNEGEGEKMLFNGNGSEVGRRVVVERE